jgi:hypothetical protein
VLVSPQGRAKGKQFFPKEEAQMKRKGTESSSDSDPKLAIRGSSANATGLWETVQGSFPLVLRNYILNDATFYGREHKQCLGEVKSFL